MFLRSRAMKWSTLRVGDIIRNGHGRPILTVAGHKRHYSSPIENKPNEDVTSRPSASSAQPTTTSAPPMGNIGSLTQHRVNKLEKFFLVWGGNYKSMDQVPNLVSQDTLERARNKARIKMNISLGVLTLVGCMVMIILGKKARKDGESVVKMNEEWHNRINEQAKLKEELKLAQAAK